jgi:hypothetical protein
MDIHAIGIDLGKALFHLVGVDSNGTVVVRKRCSRTQLLAYTANTRRTRLRAARAAWIVIAYRNCPSSARRRTWSITTPTLVAPCWRTRGPRFAPGTARRRVVPGMGLRNRPAYSCGSFLDALGGTGVPMRIRIGKFG